MTIRDVARLAGVSATTVSFVLNGVVDQAISADTQARVRKAADRLRYRPNATARLLRSNRSQTIGFITDEIASTPFAVDTIRGAQDAAAENGKLLMIVNTGSNRKVMVAAIAEMLERRVEGILYAHMHHQPVRLPEMLLEGPCVLLDCYDEDRRWASVVPDEVGGGRTATDALLAKGHRRIGFINLIPGIPASLGRLQGYREALAERGISYDESLVIYSTGDAKTGYVRGRELLEASDPPTAIFCGNDRVAMGLYQLANERGMRIPADLAVVGFDNMVLVAESLQPGLSTVALPHYEMGRWALQHLIKQDAEKRVIAEQHVMPCPYVERDSV